MERVTGRSESRACNGSDCRLRAVERSLWNGNGEAGRSMECCVPLRNGNGTSGMARRVEWMSASPERSLALRPGMEPVELCRVAQRNSPRRNERNCTAILIALPAFFRRTRPVRLPVKSLFITCIAHCPADDACICSRVNELPLLGRVGRCRAAMLFRRRRVL